MINPIVKIELIGLRDFEKLPEIYITSMHQAILANGQDLGILEEIDQVLVILRMKIADAKHKLFDNGGIRYENQ